MNNIMKFVEGDFTIDVGVNGVGETFGFHKCNHKVY
jgi:hypothetical protein